MLLSGFPFLLVSPGEKKDAQDNRKYCASCGHLIPREAAFCSYCGTAQAPQAEPARHRLPQTIAQNSRRIRTILFFSSLALFLLTFFLGSQVHMSKDEASAIVKEFEDAIGPHPTAQTIIINNSILCLQFFIPFLGLFSLAEVGFNSGNVLAAIALSSPTPVSAFTVFLLTLATPVAWIEFTAYSLASSEGTMMIISALARFLRKEAKNLLLTLAVALSLLVFGGFLEVFLINAIQG
jgi:hypothetical protein